MNVQTDYLKDKINLSLQVYDEANETWVTLIEPMDMRWSVQDLDAGGSTGRGLDGTMLRDRVAIKEKLEMEFPPMNVEDFTAMLSLIANQFFRCKYWSMKTGGMREAVMYVGDRDAKWYNKKKNSPKDMITEAKFNFIER